LVVVVVVLLLLLLQCCRKQHIIRLHVRSELRAPAGLA
jgi:hypothetical protein